MVVSLHGSNANFISIVYCQRFITLVVGYNDRAETPPENDIVFFNNQVG